MLYPLLFQPIVKPKIWGKEIWSLSGYGEDQSVVCNGFLEGNTLSEVLEVYMDELVGGRVYDRYGLHFPLLFKIIDAQDDLSIQVHPNDEQAAAMACENEEDAPAFGKTEMWVVTKATDEASIVLGFNKSTNAAEVAASLQSNTIMDLLQMVPVKKGDVALIEAGTVHALRKGTQVAEIQQTSDTTYRLYDYNRLGVDGKLRPLHVAEALHVLQYNRMAEPLVTTKGQQSVERLVNDPHFVTNRLHINQTLQRDYAPYDSFVVYMCLEGSVTVEYEDGQQTLSAGQTCLIPACLPDIALIPVNGEAVILETRAGE